jgi:hypothetical protein
VQLRLHTHTSTRHTPQQQLASKKAEWTSRNRETVSQRRDDTCTISHWYTTEQTQHTGLEAGTSSATETTHTQAHGTYHNRSSPPRGQSGHHATERPSFNDVMARVQYPTGTHRRSLSYWAGGWNIEFSRDYPHTGIRHTTVAPYSRTERTPRRRYTVSQRRDERCARLIVPMAHNGTQGKYGPHLRGSVTHTGMAPHSPLTSSATQRCKGHIGQWRRD